MELFGVGVFELGLIMLIALIVVGPQRFPEVARQIAQWIRTARAFTDAVMKDVRSAVDEIEQEVTAANDGVNPIRELNELRNELSGAARDATSTISEATQLPALPASTDTAGASEAPPLAERTEADEPVVHSMTTPSPPLDPAAFSNSDQWAAVVEAETEGTPEPTSAGEPKAGS